MTAPLEETHTQPVEVTCPGCFHPREWDTAGVCPICHYRASMEGRSAALLPVGTQLKGYVVGEKLGQGGFGITYRGFDLTLKMKVAIKEYYPSDLVGRSTDRQTVMLNSPEHGDLFRYGRRTFLQEARTVAQLRHPHLVRVLNFFELNETAYLVMDYYEGEDLARASERIQGPTAALAAGMTDHVWTAAELLGFRVPAPFLNTLETIKHLFPALDDAHHVN